jgi:hypothetical protein
VFCNFLLADLEIHAGYIPNLSKVAPWYEILISEVVNNMALPKSVKKVFSVFVQFCPMRLLDFVKYLDKMLNGLNYMFYEDLCNKSEISE